MLRAQIHSRLLTARPYGPQWLTERVLIKCGSSKLHARLTQWLSPSVVAASRNRPEPGGHSARYLDCLEAQPAAHSLSYWHYLSVTCPYIVHRRLHKACRRKGRIGSYVTAWPRTATCPTKKLQELDHRFANLCALAGAEVLSCPLPSPSLISVAVCLGATASKAAARLRRTVFDLSSAGCFLRGSRTLSSDEAINPGHAGPCASIVQELLLVQASASLHQCPCCAPTPSNSLAESKHVIALLEAGTLSAEGTLSMGAYRK